MHLCFRKNAKKTFTTVMELLLSDYSYNYKKEVFILHQKNTKLSFNSINRWVNIVYLNSFEKILYDNKRIVP